MVDMLNGVQQSRVGISASISEHAALDGIEDLLNAMRTVASNRQA